MKLNWTRNKTWIGKCSIHTIHYLTCWRVDVVNVYILSERSSAKKTDSQFVNFILTRQWSRQPTRRAGRMRCLWEFLGQEPYRFPPHHHLLSALLCIYDGFTCWMQCKQFSFSLFHPNLLPCIVAITNNKRHPDPFPRLLHSVPLTHSGKFIMRLRIMCSDPAWLSLSTLLQDYEPSSSLSWAHFRM